MITAFADYTFYTDSYLGDKIAEADFPRLALRASYLIDQRTFSRANPVIVADADADTIELIQMATCAVAEQMALASQVESTPEIKSERVGNYSVTYADGALQSEAERYLIAMATYLGPTGLLYGGFYESEL